MNQTPNIKGIRIRTVNLVMLAISLVLFLIVLYITVQISREYKATVHAMNNYINWSNATHAIQTGTDYLTEQARLYAQTLNKENADNYFHELYSNRSREKALEFLADHNLHSEDPNHDCGLKRALELSNALAFREIYVIRLLAEATGEKLENFPANVRHTRLSAADRTLPPEEKIARARDMLFNPDYQHAKKDIHNTLNQFVSEHMEATRMHQQEQAHELGRVLAEQRVVLIALCLLNILTFSMIIVLIVKPLQVYLNCIKNDRMFELVGAYEFKHLALTYNDIFTIKEHHDKMLKHKAEHDPLTGLLNRSAFDSFRNLLAHDDKPVGLLLVDVDKFKEVNDTYGHAVGDKTLCRVGWLLQHNFRADDLCIRLGGDEFAVILRGKAPGVEKIVSEKVESINQALENPPAGLPAASISVGVAFSNAGFSENLYNNADSALYRVKEAGRRGCQFYDGGNSNESAG